MASAKSTSRATNPLDNHSLDDMFTIPQSSLSHHQNHKNYDLQMQLRRRLCETERTEDILTSDKSTVVLPITVRVLLQHLRSVKVDLYWESLDCKLIYELS